MKKILISVFTALLAASCSLDVVPENAITFPSYFRTEQDIESVVFQMQSFVKMSKTPYRMQDYAGEIFDVAASWNASANIRAFNISTLKSMTYTNWKPHYEAIYMANVILENTHRAEGVAQGRIDFYNGLANFCKGYMYFELSKLWGEVVITKSSLPGVKYGKSSKIEVINEVIRCGELAYEQLPFYENMKLGNGTAITSKQFGNKGAAAALLAHAYAWKAGLIDFYGIQGEDSRAAREKAVYWADELIEGRAGSSYRLETTPHELVTIGLKGTLEGHVSHESIFELETDIKDPISPIMRSFTRAGQFWPFDPSSSDPASHNTDYIGLGISPAKLAEIYTYNDTEKDLRLPAFFSDGIYNPKDPVQNNTAYTGWKWAEANKLQMVPPIKVRYPIYVPHPWFPDQVMLDTWEQNTIIFRLGEIMLLRAECNAILGNSGPAQTDLNAIRARAGITNWPNANETSDLQLAIFRERERELIFEGYRFFDIIRNGYHKTELPAAWANMPDNDIMDGAYFLPVGTNAFTRNDLMRQNTFYMKYE